VSALLAKSGRQRWATRRFAEGRLRSVRVRPRAALGQKLKSSMRVYVFRSAPSNGHRVTTAACPKSAKNRHQPRWTFLHLALLSDPP
jgi:hypothetical protein